MAQFLLPGLVALPGLVEAPGELGLELDHPQPQDFVLAEGDAEGVFELVHGLPGGVAAGGFGLDEEGGEGGGRRALLLLGLVGEGPIGCRLLIISADVFLFHSE